MKRKKTEAFLKNSDCLIYINICRLVESLGSCSKRLHITWQHPCPCWETSPLTVLYFLAPDNNYRSLQILEGGRAKVPVKLFTYDAFVEQSVYRCFQIWTKFMPTSDDQNKTKWTEYTFLSTYIHTKLPPHAITQVAHWFFKSPWRTT